MAKKILSVPQAGTQPAKVPTPMENMINGIVAPMEQKSTIPEKQPQQTKKAVNFLCDPELLLRFKLYCTRHGRTMTSVLESAMSQILAGDELASSK